ncbi:MAG TPA: diaminopimelate epimerase [Bacteroidales bacterium]|nr:diaminopimelate epimerase [Bacteroidales bacterium]
MKFTFSKYQGTGNDFIIIDNRNNSANLTKKQIAQLCNRRFGVGADGLMLLENHLEFDFNMRYFNSDGNEGSMCGNGGRCLVAFAQSLAIIDKETTFNTIDGTHKAIIKQKDIVSLQMRDVTEILRMDGHYFVDTGSPHYVIFSQNIKDIDVYTEGKKIRESNRFAPSGTNVNFVEVRGEELYVRTYERGVENETLSCGTGVTAAAICASAEKHTDKNSLDIITRGGKLNVRFQKDTNRSYTNVWLTGPATFVFKGEFEF